MRVEQVVLRGTKPWKPSQDEPLKRRASIPETDYKMHLNKANATRNYRQFSILRWKGYHCVQSNKDLNKNLTWTGSWQEDGSTEAEKKNNGWPRARQHRSTRLCSLLFVHCPFMHPRMQIIPYINPAFAVRNESHPTSSSFRCTTSNTLFSFSSSESWNLFTKPQVELPS